MMMNEGSENKQKVEAFLTKFKIKKVTVLTYHSQTNNMIKCKTYFNNASTVKILQESVVLMKTLHVNDDMSW